MSEELSDPELIAAFKAGDAEALGLLMERHKAAESRLDPRRGGPGLGNGWIPAADSVEYSMYQAQSDMASVQRLGVQVQRSGGRGVAGGDTE